MYVYKHDHAKLNRCHDFEHIERSHSDSIWQKGNLQLLAKLGNQPESL